MNLKSNNLTKWNAVAVFFLSLWSTQILALTNDSRAVYLSPFELTNISNDVGKIFQELLSAELFKNNVSVSKNAQDANYTMEGSLSKLGDKTLIFIKVFDKQAARYSFVENVTTYDESELDVVAARLATAYAQSETFLETATVMNVLEREEEIITLRKGLSGVLFEFGSFSPTGGENYGTGENGIAVNFGYVYEAESFFYNPSIGFRRGTNNSYREVPLTLSIGKYFSNAGNSIFLAGGGGVSFLEEMLSVRETQEGGFVPIVLEETFEENEVGAVAHLKFGYIIARERAQRILIALRYDVSQANPLERDTAKAISFQIGLMSF